MHEQMRSVQMRVIGRKDNMPVAQMGLTGDIVNKLSEKGITGWNDLTMLTLRQLAEMGLKPEQITEVSNAVEKHTLNLQ